MNILICTHYFAPHTGGIERVAEQHASRIANQGHNVIVTSIDTGGSQNQDDINYQVRKYNGSNPLEQVGIPYPIPNPIEFSKTFEDILRTNDIDVVHVHGLNYLSTMLTIRKTPDQIPIILQQHTPFVQYDFPFHYLEKANDHLIGRWNLKNSNHIIAVSDNVADYVRQLKPSIRPTVIYNGIDTTKYHPSNEVSPSSLNWPDNQTNVLAVSRLSNKKGIDVFVESAKRLQSSDVHLAIIGDGPKRDLVSSAAEELDNLSFMGRVSEEKLKQAYATADLFAFTSRSGDAFPTLTIMESLSSGTPVVATAIDEYQHGLVEGETGYIIQPNSTTDLVQSIRNHIEQDHIEAMSTNARKEAEDKFDLATKIPTLLKVYDSVI